MRITEEPLEAIAAEWERLAVRLGTPPFLMPGWIEAWWRAFGSGKLSVVVLRDGDHLAGAMPIVRRRGVVISPTNWHTPLYGPVVEDAEAAGAIYDYLVGTEPRRLTLSYIEEGSPGLDRLSLGGRVHNEVILRSPYLPVNSEWEPFWKSRSKNLRSTVRRCRNRLADLGPVELDVVTGGDALQAHLDEGFGLEDSGWKEEEGTSIASRPETRRFYEDVARWAAGRGTLRLAYLRVAGRPVAFNYCLEESGVHYLVKLGHDFELHRFGPGTVLTAEMVERAFREGLRSYEFLGGPDAYKLRWTDLSHERIGVQRFARTVPGQIEEIAQVRGRQVAKRLIRR